MYFNWKLILGTLLISENFIGIFCVNIKEVTTTNIDTIQKDKPFLILYITKFDCLKCGLIFPKFLAASQSFRGSKEIVFGKVSGPKLASRLHITQFPKIVYYLFGTTKPKIYDGEITVDTIIDLIIDKNYGDFASLARHYTVDIDDKYFDQVTSQPSQCKLLLIYERKRDEEIDVFEDVAEIYKNDDDITFLRFDRTKEKTLALEFKTQYYPAMYWFDKLASQSKMFYGGRFDKYELSSFISDKTGIIRLLDGNLDKTAGTVEEIEKVIEDYAEDIEEVIYMDEVISKVKQIAKQFDKKDLQRLAHYYVHLLKEIKRAESTTALTDEKYNIMQLRATDIGPKSADLLKKKQNIINSIIDLVGYPLSQGKENSKMVMAREQLPVELHKEYDEDVEKMMKKLSNMNKKKKSKKAKKKHTHDEL